MSSFTLKSARCCERSRPEAPAPSTVLGAEKPACPSANIFYFGAAADTCWFTRYIRANVASAIAITTYPNKSK